MAGCILISDTQMASRRMLRFALELKGAEVLECAAVEETLAILEARQVDLLLVSLYPREREGYILLEQIKERAVTAMLPVVLVGDEMLRAEAGAQLWRGVAWLDRPFRVSELMALVDGIFSKQPALPDERTNLPQ